MTSGTTSPPGKRGAKLIFHYNKRDEKTDPQALASRGHNEVGWPYAPCGIVMHPNGYDEGDKRLKFICHKGAPLATKTAPSRPMPWAV